MANNFFLFVIKDIISDPVKAWEAVDSENKPVNIIRNSFLFPLIFLVSVSATAGSILFVNTGLSPVYSVFAGIKCFLLFYLTVYATALILKEITHALDLGRNFAVSFRIVAYSIVPLMLCQLVSRLFESLLFVNVLALYSLYLFWTGAGRMFTPPAHKRMPLLVACVVTFIVIFIASDVVLSKLLDKIFYAFFS
jgi:hypothetical protein